MPLFMVIWMLVGSRMAYKASGVEHHIVDVAPMHKDVWGQWTVDVSDEKVAKK